MSQTKFFARTETGFKVQDELSLDSEENFKQCAFISIPLLLEITFDGLTAPLILCTYSQADTLGQTDQAISAPLLQAVMITQSIQNSPLPPSPLLVCLAHFESVELLVEWVCTKYWGGKRRRGGNVTVCTFKRTNITPSSYYLVLSNIFHIKMTRCTTR